MTIYAVTFRIDNDDDYFKRYNSFVKAIDKESGNSHWEETTSLYIFESSKKTDTLCSDLYTGSDFDKTKDTMVVINLSVKEYAERGVKYPNTLKKYLGNR